uniref:AB hydrolase-1 domain-containing protein n=1 Tax=Strigamia maritima TaxID=126957 RepID=T1ILB6_STRMM
MKRILLLFVIILFSAVAYLYFSITTVVHERMSNIDWENVDLKEPVVKLDNLMQGIAVTEHTIALQDCDVFYRKAACNDSKCMNVLFLHGMRFKSETWLNLKTLHYVAGWGFNVTAIDFPGKMFFNRLLPDFGYGESSKEQVPEPDRANFLHQLIISLNLAPCVIVSPSLSGSFTIPLLKSHPEDFLAYIPIAPIWTNSLSSAEYQTLTIPTLVLCGEKDENIGRESISNLKHIPTSQVFIIPKAGHAAYLDDPETFHNVLYNFLQLVSKFQKTK